MNKQLFIQRIQKNFPDLQFSKSEIIDHGWNKTVIILDNKIVFAFPKNKEAEEKFKIELAILPKLNKKITLAMPNFQYTPQDKSFVGYNLVEGEPLSLEYFEKLDSRQKNLIARQIGGFLSELHSFSVRVAKKSGVKSAWQEQDARSYYQEQAETVFKKLVKKDQEKLKSIFENYCSGKIPRRLRKTLVHQDLTADHIFINNRSKKVTGIIDFGEIQIADPAVDFSKLWEYNEKFVDTVLKNYSTKDLELKTRSYRWFIYQCIGNMYCGITMKRKDYWEKGYRLIAV